MKKEAVALPRELEAEPRIKIKDLTPGASGWVIWDALEVDKDGHCYLNPKAKVTSRQNPFRILVRLEEDGFIVEVPRSSELTWNRETASLYGLIPVVRLTVTPVIHSNDVLVENTSPQPPGD